MYVLMALYPEHVLPESSLDTFHVFEPWIGLAVTGRKDGWDVSLQSTKNRSGYVAI